MKKIILSAAILACGFTFNSCNKVANQLAQTIGWSGLDVTIDVPPSTAIGTYTAIGAGTFNYNLDSFIKSKTSDLLGMKNIEEFKFKSCQLTILNPGPTNSFGDFSDAKAEFSTSTKMTPKVKLGEVNGNPDGLSSSLTLPINTSDNMRPYLPASGPVTIYYNLSGTMRRVRTTTTTVNVHIEYEIKVKG
ncbi:MAG: hypothetical protein K0Q79_3359 [Flavipsychrobacter sp.]|jgi:hypothetical protein|nr:hypothetical protein [Flavipsychrobacter sp.]